MAALTEVTTKRETLNIRIKPEERNLIDRAARMRGKNRTESEFVMADKFS